MVALILNLPFWKIRMELIVRFGWFLLLLGCFSLLNRAGGEYSPGSGAVR